MGTMLYSRGVFINRCFDELNLTAPLLVSGIHQEYAAAGAEILETNTYGANHTRLKSFRLADQVEAINSEGVRLAKQAAQDRAFCGGRHGSLGPSYRADRHRLRYRGPRRLSPAGGRSLILESFTDLRELREAVRGAGCGR
jgi:homocysteine S-methyltransferase